MYTSYPLWKFQNAKLLLESNTSQKGKVAKVQEEIEHLCSSIKIYSTNHCSAVSVDSVLCSVTTMDPANGMDCGIVCAEDMLPRYPYPLGQGEQRR